MPHKNLATEQKLAVRDPTLGHSAVRCVVEDDVQRTQVPSLLVSANGLHTALVQALMRLSGSSFMEKELVMLVKD